MMKQKILSLLAGTIAVVGLLLFTLPGMAPMDGAVVSAARSLLEAESRQLKGVITTYGDGLPALARDLASREGIEGDLRLLSFALIAVRPGGQPTSFQQSRIDQGTERLDEIVATFRDEHPGVAGAALIDDKGRVLLSDSKVLLQGEMVLAEDSQDDEGAEKGDSADEQSGAGEAAARVPTALVTKALAGGSPRVARLHEGAIYYLGAAPVYRGSNVIGAVVIQRVLEKLPAGGSADAALVAGDKTLLGRTPAGFVTRVPEGRAGFATIPLPARSNAFGSEFGFSGAFMDGRSPSIWVKELAIEVIEDVSIVVSTEVRDVYSVLFGAQLTLIVMAFIIWIAIVSIVLSAGFTLGRGLTVLSDFVGRVQQGGSAERSIDERQLPAELRRLARLINKLVIDGQSVAATSALSALPSSPSVDDVLQAADANASELSGEALNYPTAAETHEVPAARAMPEADEVVDDNEYAHNEFSELEFEGISNAGSIGLGEPDEDGYDDSIASVAADLVQEDVGPDRGWQPPSEEAIEAVDHIDDGPSGLEAKQGASPAEVPEGATSVMTVSPELLAAMRDAEPEPDAVEPPSPPATDDAVDAAPAVQPIAPTDMAGATAVMKLTPELLAQASGAVPGMEEAVPAAPAKPAGPQENPHFKEVFEQFMATRRECGEVGDLSFNKFARRLDQSRAAVIAKHNCRDVLFQVHVKNGKAALKAMPAR